MGKLPQGLALEVPFLSEEEGRFRRWLGLVAGTVLFLALI